MADKTKIEQLKERFAQQARAGIPFNPVDGADITGANVERLKVGMETFGWKDYRFVTEEQARTNGWTIRAKANSVRITTRDPSNGSVAEKTLYNASNVRGMPSLEEMLAMPEVAMRKMRGEEVEVVAPVEQQDRAERDADTAEASGGEVEDDMVIGPVRLSEQKVAPGRDGNPQDVNDLFLGEPVGVLDAPASQWATVGEDDRPNSEQAAEPAVESDFAVMAPYWLDRLHNYEGLQLAERLNRLIEAEKLAKDKASIGALLNSYPESRRLGLDIVPRSKYLNDPARKANVGEPALLLGGELVRDKEGAYRPKVGGLAVLQDQGTSLVLKNKSEQAYRGAMELARAKGWTAIELKGKPKMLAQAWLEAKMMNLEVVNYTPTEQDREKLAQRMAEEDKRREAAAAKAEAPAPEQVEVRPVVDAAGKQVMATVTYRVEPTGAAPQQIDPSKDAVAGSQAEVPIEEPVVMRTVTRVDGLIRDEVEVKSEQSNLVNLEKGARLVAHGPAPYDHNPKNKASYYVTVETEGGQSKTVWGKDLERSLSEASAVTGDMISLVDGAREPVQVRVDEPDGSKTWKMTHRVTWSTAVLSRAAEVVHEGASAPAVNVASSGIFIGPIVRVEDGRIAQKAGRDSNKLIWHEVSKLQGKVPKVGEIAEIKYAKGVGKVKEPQRAQELAR